MLACARIGAIHSVVFGGFSPEALAGRIEDCRSRLVITADEGLRGGRTRAAEGQRRRGAGAPCARTRSHQVIVVRRTGAEVPMKAGRDVWYARGRGRRRRPTARRRR